jgi:hypothetical protein
MAAICKFCNRVFEKKQGVRAHLKACVNYLATKQKREKPQRPLKASLAKSEVLPKTEVYEEVELSDGTLIYRGEDGMRYFESTRERLLYHRDQEAKRNSQNKIRLQQEQGGLRREEEEKRRYQEEQERCRQLETERERRREKDEKERREREKGLVIQSVKMLVIDCHFGSYVSVAAKAAAKIAIEKELSSLRRLLELPRFELNQIAEGIREKIYAPYIKALKSEKPTQKEVMNPMAKEKLFSGIFCCSICQTEFDIDRAKKDELICDACGGDLEEAPEDDDEEE